VHLVIDGYGADPARLQDTDLVLRFLDDHPSAIGMTKIAPPEVHTYRGSKPEDWGVSGFVLIAESHISIHTFPEKAYLNVDIFSCKVFDAAASIADLTDAFSLADVKTLTLDRGIEHLSAGQARTATERERAELTPGEIRISS
jgi:S-adenosylmethionine decarboxylase